MKAFLRWLGIFDNDPPIGHYKGIIQPSGFKMRVALYDRDGEYYALYYFNGRGWHLLTKAWAPSGYPLDLISNDQPVMFRSFDDAVREAQNFKSMKDIEAHLERENGIYDARRRELLAERKNRRKEWQSDEQPTNPTP